MDNVERTARPSAGGIPVPEREEVLTAPEGILAPHITAEAIERVDVLEPAASDTLGAQPDTAAEE